MKPLLYYPQNPTAKSLKHSLKPIPQFCAIKVTIIKWTFKGISGSSWDILAEKSSFIEKRLIQGLLVVS